MYINKCISSIYTNWQDGQPDNWSFKEYCIRMRGDSTKSDFKGDWVDIPCTWKMKCVLCQNQT